MEFGLFLRRICSFFLHKHCGGHDQLQARSLRLVMLLIELLDRILFPLFPSCRIFPGPRWKFQGQLRAHGPSCCTSLDPREYP